jgi:hypothetical protein
MRRTTPKMLWLKRVSPLTGTFFGATANLEAMLSGAFDNSLISGAANLQPLFDIDSLTMWIRYNA